MFICVGEVIPYKGINATELLKVGAHHSILFICVNFSKIKRVFHPIKNILPQEHVVKILKLISVMIIDSFPKQIYTQTHGAPG